MSTAGALGPRAYHTAVWTGTRMVVNGGRVTGANGLGVVGLSVRLDSPRLTAPRYVTTGTSGVYTFANLASGADYTVTSGDAAWAFSPDSLSYPALAQSVGTADFTATRAGYAISGRLTDQNGNPVYPATVNLSGSKVAAAGTDVNGNYTFYNLAPGGTYTVQPYKNLWDFAPNFRTFENLSGPQTADFVGTPQGTTYTLGGRLVDNTGAPMPNFRLRLETTRVPSTQYRTTDADGRYQFTGLPAGSEFLIVPEDADGGYSYEPTHLIYSTVVRHIADANFAATATGTPLTNLAVGRAATQSSDYGGPNARLAVDGNTNGNYSAGSVTHTSNDSQAWRQVDLGAVRLISEVRVWNRTDGSWDRLSDFYVVVSDVPFASNDLTATPAQTGVWNQHTAGRAGSPSSILVGRTGRYVRVQLAGTNYLSLAEVEVIGQ